MDEEYTVRLDEVSPGYIREIAEHLTGDAPDELLDKLDYIGRERAKAKARYESLEQMRKTVLSDCEADVRQSFEGQTHDDEGYKLTDGNIEKKARRHKDYKDHLRKTAQARRQYYAKDAVYWYAREKVLHQREEMKLARVTYG